VTALLPAVDLAEGVVEVEATAAHRSAWCASSPPAAPAQFLGIVLDASPPTVVPRLASCGLAAGGGSTSCSIVWKVI
jgi:hypothetical protein